MKPEDKAKLYEQTNQYHVNNGYGNVFTSKANDPAGLLLKQSPPSGNENWDSSKHYRNTVPNIFEVGAQHLGKIFHANATDAVQIMANGSWTFTQGWAGAVNTYDGTGFDAFGSVSIVRNGWYEMELTGTVSVRGGGVCTFAAPSARLTTPAPAVVYYPQGTAKISIGAAAGMIEAPVVMHQYQYIDTTVYNLVQPGMFVVWTGAGNAYLNVATWRVSLILPDGDYK